MTSRPGPNSVDQVTTPFARVSAADKQPSDGQGVTAKRTALETGAVQQG